MNRKEIPAIKQTALLVACAAAIQMAESLMPQPLPGIRLGLANLITLITLDRYGFRSALEISLLRTVVGALFLGTFLAPAFLLSFAAAGMSVAVMGLLDRAATARERPAFSLVGISVVGAAAHNLTQLALAYLLLLHHPGIFLLLPWLGISAVMTGWGTGLVASMVCRRLENMPAVIPAVNNAPATIVPTLRLAPSPDSGIPARSILHRLPFAGKAGLVLLVMAAALVCPSFWVMAALLSLLTALAGVARLSPASLLTGLKSLAPFLMFSFLTPVLLTHSGLILIHMGPVTVTQEGIYAGCRFGLRLIVLMAGANLLARIATGQDIVTGLRTVLAPLKVVGVSPERLTAIITLALRAVPELSARLCRSIRLQSKLYGWRNTLPATAEWLAIIYRETEEKPV